MNERMNESLTRPHVCLQTDTYQTDRQTDEEEPRRQQNRRGEERVVYTSQTDRQKTERSLYSKQEHRRRIRH